MGDSANMLDDVTPYNFSYICDMFEDYSCSFCMYHGYTCFNCFNISNYCTHSRFKYLVIDLWSIGSKGILLIYW